MHILAKVTFLLVYLYFFGNVRPWPCRHGRSVVRASIQRTWLACAAQQGPSLGAVGLPATQHGLHDALSHHGHDGPPSGPDRRPSWGPNSDKRRRLFRVDRRQQGTRKKIIVFSPADQIKRCGKSSMHLLLPRAGTVPDFINS